MDAAELRTMRVERIIAILLHHNLNAEDGRYWPDRFRRKFHALASPCCRPGTTEPPKRSTLRLASVPKSDAEDWPCRLAPARTRRGTAPSGSINASWPGFLDRHAWPKKDAGLCHRLSPYGWGSRTKPTTQGARDRFTDRAGEIVGSFPRFEIGGGHRDPPALDTPRAPIPDSGARLVCLGPEIAGQSDVRVVADSRKPCQPHGMVSDSRK